LIEKEVEIMKSEKKLNFKKQNISINIYENYPELSEYIGEMPFTIPNTESPELTVDNLRAYFNSLTFILGKYICDINWKT